MTKCSDRLAELQKRLKDQCCTVIDCKKRTCDGGCLSVAIESLEKLLEEEAENER